MVQNFPISEPDISALIAQAPYIRLLALFGSRARGAATSQSDWDFAVLRDLQQCSDYEPDGLNPVQLYPVLGEAFGVPVDRVDVVDLTTCSPAIAYYVARDGMALYERETGAFQRFQRRAWKRYADTQKFRDLRRRTIALRLEHQYEEIDNQIVFGAIGKACVQFPEYVRYVLAYLESLGAASL